MSNTKLDTSQKESRKEMKACVRANDGQIFSFPHHGVTVAIEPAFPGSRMVNVSVSFMSPNEQKFRRKVGEYYALYRMRSGEYVQVPNSLEWATIAEYFAELAD